jgi:hypothetical protein
MKPEAVLKDFDVQVIRSCSEAIMLSLPAIPLARTPAIPIAHFDPPQFHPGI